MGNKRSIWAWAFYDWANSAFATTVMAGFFPVFFKKYWSLGATITESTFYLGIGNSLASCFVALSAPFLGALADVGARKKSLLQSFMLLGAFSTAGLFFVSMGQWPTAIALYALAVVGFSCANTFYDSLLVDVARADQLDSVSALGYSLGYLGGALLFTLNVLMYLKPEVFGLAGPIEAVQWSFLSVALWWVVFSAPLSAWVNERAPVEKRQPFFQQLRLSAHQLNKTIGHLAKTPKLSVFLVSYLFYIDGVNTIIKMAVDFGLSLGFSDQHLIAALLITNFVGFPAAIVFGRLGERIGALNGIYVALFVYGCVTLASYFISDVSHFYGLAVAIGLVQGGIQSLSRSYFASITPAEKSAEYFGFFNMLGKVGAIIGPFLAGLVSYWTGQTRLSLVVILLFFIIGALGLRTHQRLRDP